MSVMYVIKVDLPLTLGYKSLAVATEVVELLNTGLDNMQYVPENDTTTIAKITTQLQPSNVPKTPELSERDKFFARYGERDAKPGYDIFYFSGLSGEEAVLAMKNGWIEPTDRHNDAPWAQELIDFAIKWRTASVTLGGYVVSPERADTRVTIDTVECNMPEYVNRDFVKEWIELGAMSDERDLNRIWWD